MNACAMVAACIERQQGQPDYNITTTLVNAVSDQGEYVREVVVARDVVPLDPVVPEAWAG